MSRDAVKTAIEPQADPQLSEALEDVRAAGEKSLLEAVKNAKIESIEMLKKAEAEAAKQAQDLASNTENKKAAMRVRAEREMEKAVALIVEDVQNQAKAEGWQSV